MPKRGSTTICSKTRSAMRRLGVICTCTEVFFKRQRKELKQSQIQCPRIVQLPAPRRRTTHKVQSALRSTSIQRWLDSSIEEEGWDAPVVRHVSSTPQVHKTTTPPRQRHARAHELALLWVPAGHPRCTRAHFGGVAHQHTIQQHNVIHITAP